MRAQASRISSSRTDALRDTLEFRLDSLQEAGLTGRQGQEVDPGFQTVLKEQLESHETAEIGWTGELDENVPIAPGLRLPARSGTKDPRLAYAMGPHFRSQALQRDPRLGGEGLGGIRLRHGAGR